MSVIDKYIKLAKKRSMSVVLPEGQDERVVAAARRLKDQGICDPVVLGKPEQIEQACQQAGVDLQGITTIDPAKSDKLDTYVKKYVEGRDISEGVAKRMVKRPLFYAGMMVACGDVDTMIAGVVNATATVIQAGALTVGFAPGIETASSFFLMIIPEFQGKSNVSFIYADCAVNISPTPEELADIAIASQASASKLLEEEPRVALLSFSTKGSAAHEDIDKVHSSLAIIKQRAPELKIDGEFQADAAIIAAVGAKKVKEPSAVVGQANVLIFPDLNSGNIAYKLTQYMANAQAVGPFLQGFAKPISDLSRGASVDDIVATTAITITQV